MHIYWYADISTDLWYTAHQNESWEKLWEVLLLRLMFCLCLLPGGFLGHAGIDGGLLHVHQQEGLWVIQSLKVQVSSSQSQNQGKGVCGGGGFLHLLCPLSLCPCPLHSHPNGQHGESLQGTAGSLHCKGNHPVAVGHQCVFRPAYLCVPV